MEIETSDVRLSDIRLSGACSASVLRRKTVGSLEPGAGSVSHRVVTVDRVTVNRA